MTTAEPFPTTLTPADRNATGYPRSATLAKPARTVPTSCVRCGGDGVWKGWHRGTCFRCGGRGTDPTYFDWAYPATWTDADIEAWHAKRQAASAKRADAAQAKRDAAWVALLGRHPVLQALADLADAQPDPPSLADLDDPNYVEPPLPPHTCWADLPGFAIDIYHKARRYADKGDPTERQLTALASALESAATNAERRAARAQEHANAQPVPTGRQTIEGTVVAVRSVEGNYGWSLKMMVKGDAGWRVWVTVPAKMERPALGDRIRVTCEISPAADDPTMGFGARPTKGERLDCGCGDINHLCSTHQALYQREHGRASNE